MSKLLFYPLTQNQTVPPASSPLRRSLTRFLLVAGCLAMLAFSSTSPALAQFRPSNTGAGDTVGNDEEEDLDAMLEYLWGPLTPRYGPLREQPQVYGPFVDYEPFVQEHGPVPEHTPNSWDLRPLWLYGPDLQGFSNPSLIPGQTEEDTHE